VPGLGPADGPLAVALHGFPDTAWTWRYLGPHLAGLGWRVVAPFLRGYAPSGLASSYHVGALAADAVALHRELGGDDRTVLVGHDWARSPRTRSAPTRTRRTGGS
jgi:pimeloyl-ACP methyl ester carboxylesterase